MGQIFVGMSSEIVVQSGAVGEVEEVLPQRICCCEISSSFDGGPEKTKAECDRDRAVY